MVNVIDKKITKRRAVAQAKMFLGKEIVTLLNGSEIHTKKGPVFQTAIIAGIQGVKKTSEIIPMCHPLLINGVDINIHVINSEHIEVLCEVIIEGKTGVEMEALTAASIAALTVYDMCKAVDRFMTIDHVQLLEKKGGKSDYIDHFKQALTAAVIVCSDSISQGQKEDRAGKVIVEKLKAYGVEIKDMFSSCEAVNVAERTIKTFKKEDCNFGYRESVFKNELKNKYIITSVVFKLTKKNHKTQAVSNTLNERPELCIAFKLGSPMVP